MSAPRVLTVDLQAQGIRRPPADLGRCVHFMERDTRPRSGRNGVTRPKPFRRRCPNAAVVVAWGRGLCAAHAGGADRAG